MREQISIAAGINASNPTVGETVFFQAIRAVRNQRTYRHPEKRTKLGRPLNVKPVYYDLIHGEILEINGDLLSIKGCNGGLYCRNVKDIVQIKDIETWSRKNPGKWIMPLAVEL